jgi:hypothetical protein
MQVPLPDGGVETLAGPQTIVACNLVEFQPDGTVVWTWKATDHFDAVADSIAPILSPEGPTGSAAVDPFHCNAIDVDPNNGNLLVSAREMNSIFYVERSSGNVLWKMGGAPANKDGASYVSVASPFALQHDARFQPDWSPPATGGAGISRSSTTRRTAGRCPRARWSTTSPSARERRRMAAARATGPRRGRRRWRGSGRGKAPRWRWGASASCRTARA